MKKIYDLWVKYCPIPKLLGLRKKVDVKPIAPYKLKRTNKTALIEMAVNEYGLKIDKKMTKNQIIDEIVKFYNNL